jgi:hypothetical protein
MASAITLMLASIVLNAALGSASSGRFFVVMVGPQASMLSRPVGLPGAMPAQRLAFSIVVALPSSAISPAGKLLLVKVGVGTISPG